MVFLTEPVLREDGPLFRYAVNLHRKEWWDVYNIAEGKKQAAGVLRYFLGDENYFKVLKKGSKNVGCAVGSRLSSVASEIKEQNSSSFRIAESFLERMRSDAFYLSSIIVEESVRGTGAGTVLVRDTREYAQEQGMGLYCADVLSPSLEHILDKEMKKRLLKVRISGPEEKYLMIYRV